MFSQIEVGRAQQVAGADQAVEHPFEVCVAFEAFRFTFGSLRKPPGGSAPAVMRELGSALLSGKMQTQGQVIGVSR